jgi:hypothetical protein
MIVNKALTKIEEEDIKKCLKIYEKTLLKSENKEVIVAKEKVKEKPKNLYKILPFALIDLFAIIYLIVNQGSCPILKSEFLSFLACITSIFSYIYSVLTSPILIVYLIISIVRRRNESK